MSPQSLTRRRCSKSITAGSSTRFVPVFARSSESSVPHAETEKTPKVIRCGRVTVVIRNRFCKIMPLLKSVLRSDSLRAPVAGCPPTQAPPPNPSPGSRTRRTLPPTVSAASFFRVRINRSSLSHYAFDEMRAGLGDRALECRLEDVDVGGAHGLNPEAFGN